MENIDNFLKSLNIKIDNNKYLKFLSNLKSEIKDNKNSIKKVNEIDFKYTEKIVNIDKLLKIIEEFEQMKISEKDNFENVFISYSGDPYITLNLCLLAVVKKCKLILDINDKMLGVNKLLVSLVNNSLKEYKIPNIIQMVNLISENDIKNKQDYFYKIIFVDNINTYNLFKKSNIKNVEYFPLYSIDMYCDNDEYEELQKKIFEYAYMNGTDIEVYSDYEIDEVIDIINEFGTGNIALLLTKSKDNADKFKSRIVGKTIFVNENPFKSEYILLPEKLF